MSLKRIIISGGGTGGHIFPAIAIANALKEKDSSIEILFVGAEGKMEMEKVPAEGYKIVGLPVAGFQRKLTVQNFVTVYKLGKSLVQAWKIVGDFKPEVCVGVGGYASGPVLRVAGMKGIQSVIQEQNSFPGVTNKILASKVKKIFVAYDGLEKFFPSYKLILTGNPVRKNLLDVQNLKTQAVEFFQTSGFKKVVLLMGGSLGARAMNDSVKAQLELIKTNPDVCFLWQTGKIYFDKIMADKTNLPENLRPLDFISRMDMAYSAADIIVSRAGAIAISELCVVGKPCILVPSPNVAEDHQTKNAMVLVNKQAALMVKDAEAKEQLIKSVIDLIGNEQLQSTLATNCKKLAKTDAAERIAEEILEMIA